MEIRESVQLFELHNVVLVEHKEEMTAVVRVF